MADLPSAEARNGAVPGQPSALDEWRRGWGVVLAGALGMGLASVSIYSIGIFTGPLEDEFGWSRAEVASGMTFISVLGVLTAPFVGMLIDRWGPRRIGLPGVAFYCMAIAALSQATGSLAVWWGLWFLYSLAATMIKPTIWTAAVSSVFARGRGLALSVMLCGTGLGSSLTPLVGNWLIDSYDWRTAYVLLGCFWMALVFPAVFLLFHSRKDKARPSEPNAGEATDLTGISVREGLRSTTFAKLAGAAFVASLVIVSFASGLVPILTWQGLTRTEAASIAGLVGISTVIGRLVGGYLLDRINGSGVGGVSLLLPIVSALLLLAGDGDLRLATVAAAILGLSLGVELDAVAYLATRHFGLRNFGALFGTVSGLLALATGVGPLLISLSYDHFGGYREVLIAYVPLCVLSSALFFALGRYPVFSAAAARA